MKTIKVSSLDNRFEPYLIKRVITVQYVKRTLLITYLDEFGDPSTTAYCDEDIAIIEY